jgi:large subunit ribosomal protein L23
MSNHNHSKPHYVIISPVVTEKYSQSAVLTHKGKKRGEVAEEPCQRLAFKVAKWANKTQIKTALGQLFEGKKIKSIRTINCKGKRRRNRRGFGFTGDWKKAIVTLAPGDSIDLV